MKFKNFFKRLPFFKKPEPKPSIDYKAIILLTVLASFAAGYVQWEAQKPLDEPSMALTILPSQLARITVDFGNGTRREFRGEVIPNLNPLMALQFSAETGGISYSVTTSTKSGGAEITQVDGQRSGKKNRWTLYVNGANDVDPVGYEVKPLDDIVWRYE